MNMSTCILSSIIDLNGISKWTMQNWLLTGVPPWQFHKKTQIELPFPIHALSDSRYHRPDVEVRLHHRTLLVMLSLQHQPGKDSSSVCTCEK